MIKEIATCAYLMVIQTPRLCNDVAFQPPHKDHPNLITCSAILSPADVPAFQSEIAASATAAIASRFPNPFEPDRSDAPQEVGGIVIGGHKWVPEGQEIEKSAIVGGGKETYVDTIANSMGKMYSTEQLQKLGVGDLKTVDRLKKELDKIAGDKGWKLEVFDTAHGREYRGVIGDEEEEDGESSEIAEGEKDNERNEAAQREGGKREKDTGDDGKQQEGSEETYKDEL